MAESTSASPKLTPMMEQYRSIKKTLPPDTILFFRLGDFYEMFFGINPVPLPKVPGLIFSF